MILQTINPLGTLLVLIGGVGFTLFLSTFRGGR